ncbi:MAG: 4Fe-4S dicluster domain-containing protein [Elusimicrobia bacterium]|nr:4Fe-4S dicluster domain-containing protein [Elusimicrobiota bacterium]MDE2314369.1 4Fe-4S dicluster domain-containing protein [Elusimicrobiota bacterium]
MSESKDVKIDFTVEAKLGTLEWKKSPNSHIALKDASAESPCATECKTKPCTTVCPAKVYEWHEDGRKIIVNYENCIECGACRMLCPFDNIVCDWPEGGMGVKYKLG